MAPDNPVWGKIAGYLESKDLASFGWANKKFSKHAKVVAERRTPFPDKYIFITATKQHYPKAFSKGEYTSFEVDYKTNIKTGWNQYNKVGKSFEEGMEGIAAFVERMDDNRYIFHEKRMNKGVTESLEKGGLLFSPPKGAWTPQMNDAWILGLVHRGYPVLLLSAPILDVLYDSEEKRPTQTGREVLLLLESGYTIETGVSADPFKSGGLLFKPPKNSTLSLIEYATPSDPKDKLVKFSETSKSSFSPPVLGEKYREKEYDSLSLKDIKEHYRVQQVSGAQSKVKKIVNAVTELNGQVNILKDQKKSHRHDKAKKEYARIAEKLSDEVKAVLAIIRKFANKDEAEFLGEALKNAAQKLPSEVVSHIQSGNFVYQ